MTGLSTSHEICASYTFPYLERIEPVLKAVEGRPEFVVAEREFGTVIDYNYITPDTFPPISEDDINTKILRECRGIMFSKTGALISRPFHKFFNVGERPETQYNVVSKEMAKVLVYPKMDGSMIRPVRMSGGEYRLATRMGLTDVAKKAEDFLVESGQWHTYHEFFDDCHAVNVTPLFEFCSPDNRIVVNYSAPKLVLLNIRHLHYGTYSGPSGSEKISMAGVQYRGPLDIHKFVDAVKEDESGIEGYIIELERGNFVKLKTEWYVTIHRTRDSIMHEKHIVKAILDGVIDDILGNVPENDAKIIMDFQTKFWAGLQKTIENWDHFYESAKKTFKTKKDYALWNATPRPEVPPMLRSAVFALWDGKCESMHAFITAAILRNLGSQSKVDEVRDLWDNHKYVYQGVVNEEA